MENEAGYKRREALYKSMFPAGCSCSRGGSAIFCECNSLDDILARDAERADDSEECSTCGGDGVVIEDTCENGRESSDEVECPDCNGAGHITDDGPSFADDYSEHDIDDGPLPRESPL